jgi:hypothetical protein
LQHYWAGGFHPKAIGTPTVENTYLDRGFGPAQSPPKGLMDFRRGPVGGARQVFQTNFAFGWAVRLQAQNVHPGYWQSAHPDEDGYRPDQIMRYSEGNLNRLQIVGELHVKSGKVLEPERVPELDAPLELAHLTEEGSWENRAQMGRTSARDFVEALLLDVHHARYLQAHPHVQVKRSLLQDQLLGEGEETVKRHGGPKMLARLHKKARELNLEGSRNRIKSDYIEPETLFWAAWKVLPGGHRARGHLGFCRAGRAGGRHGSETRLHARPHGVAPSSHLARAVAGTGRQAGEDEVYRSGRSGAQGMAAKQGAVLGAATGLLSSGSDTPLGRGLTALGQGV